MPLDPVTGFLVEKAAEEAAGFLVGKFKEMLSPNDARIEELRRQHHEQAVTAAFIALGKEDATEKDVAAVWDELWAMRAAIAYLVEAERSQSNERIRMLAAAFAGTFTPDLPADRKERAYRIAMTLQPSDVVFLRDYTTGEERPVPPGDGPPPDAAEHARREQLASKNGVSFNALLVSGCLYMLSGRQVGARSFLSDWFTIDGIAVRTITGADVLKLLETYDPKDPPFTWAKPSSP